MNRGVIRSLGGRESYKTGGERARRFSRTLRVTTSLNLFSRLGFMNRTIRLWMSVHPLLRANIVDIEGKKCFVYDSRFDQDRQWTKDVSDLDNVKYLVLDPAKLVGVEDKAGFFDDISGLICERELAFESDLSKQLLWSLLVLEVQENREYDITLVISHAISEARNAHMILLQLLDLIEHQWQLDETIERQTVLKELEVSPSIEELYFNSFDRSKYSNRRMETIPLVVKASYIDPISATKSPNRAYEWSKRLQDEPIYQLASSTKSELITIGKLIETSASILAKTIRRTLTSDQTAKLVNKCKTKGCTVNFALVNLFAYALRKLDENLDQNGGQINAVVPMTLRQFEPTLPGYEASPEFTDQLSVGYYIYRTIIPLEILMGLDSSMLEDSDKFWESCCHSNRLVREVIANKEMFFPYIDREMKSHEAEATLIVSNFGRLPDKLPEKYSLSAEREAFSVKQAFTEIEIDVPGFFVGDPIYIYASTCNGRLNFSFVYNSSVMSHSNASRAVELFSSVFETFIMQ